MSEAMPYINYHNGTSYIDMTYEHDCHVENSQYFVHIE